MSSECTISIYIQSKVSLYEKIQAIEVLIESMFLKIAETTSGQAAIINEYWMDDGQMKVKTSYRSVVDVEAGISALEKMKQRYINQYNGRGMVLRDVRGINR